MNPTTGKPVWVPKKIDVEICGCCIAMIIGTVMLGCRISDKPVQNGLCHPEFGKVTSFDASWGMGKILRPLTSP